MQYSDPWVRGHQTQQKEKGLGPLQLSVAIAHVHLHIDTNALCILFTLHTSFIEKPSGFLSIREEMDIFKSPLLGPGVVMNALNPST